MVADLFRDRRDVLVTGRRGVRREFLSQIVLRGCRHAWTTFLLRLPLLTQLRMVLKQEARGTSAQLGRVVQDELGEPWIGSQGDHVHGDRVTEVNRLAIDLVAAGSGLVHQTGV